MAQNRQNLEQFEQIVERFEQIWEQFGNVLSKFENNLSKFENNLSKVENNLSKVGNVLSKVGNVLSKFENNLSKFWNVFWKFGAVCVSVPYPSYSCVFTWWGKVNSSFLFSSWHVRNKVLTKKHTIHLGIRRILWLLVMTLGQKRKKKTQKRRFVAVIILSMATFHCTS